MGTSERRFLFVVLTPISCNGWGCAHSGAESLLVTNFLLWPRILLEFQAALLEGDPQALPQRVKAARNRNCSETAGVDAQLKRHVERQAIFDAMRTLCAIQTER